MQKILMTCSMILILTACSHIAQEKFTPSPQIMADCFASFHVSAWNDLNQDGVWDGSEPPLEEVGFHIDGRFAQVLSKYPCISNAEGKCTISTWAPGECVEASYTITAIPPQSYRSTSPDTIVLSLAPDEHVTESQFGFYFYNQ